MTHFKCTMTYANSQCIYPHFFSFFLSFDVYVFFFSTLFRLLACSIDFIIHKSDWAEIQLHWLLLKRFVQECVRSVFYLFLSVWYWYENEGNGRRMSERTERERRAIAREPLKSETFPRHCASIHVQYALCYTDIVFAPLRNNKHTAMPLSIETTSDTHTHRERSVF